MTEGPIARYRHLLADGTLTPDPAQELAAEKLQTLHRRLAGYRPAASGGWRHRLGMSRPQAPAPIGIYLFGDVGRGKTMLMDLFYGAAPVVAKRRAHFHAFMQDVHRRVHAWRQRKPPAAADPIPPLADALAREAWLLCFDELEVQDIADAMIVSRLFRALLDRGTVVVATSNRAPNDLYLDGLQRDRFLPFIALLNERLDVLQLDGPNDYRRLGWHGMQVYHTPLGPEAERALDADYAKLVGGAEPVAETLTLLGRVLDVPSANQGVARFTFDALCARPLGAADYLALAAHFHTVMISGIPEMPPEKRNEARRFAILIDILYDHNVKVICSAAGPPESLYASGTGTFEFKRTISRLIEMQGEAYLDAAHRPMGQDRIRLEQSGS